MHLRDVGPPSGAFALMYSRCTGRNKSMAREMICARTRLGVFSTATAMRKACHSIFALLCLSGAAYGFQRLPAAKPVPARTPPPGIAPQDLRTEYLTNPLGLDVESPRFSWVLKSAQRNQRQSAYQVLAAGTEQALKDGTGDKWDSGKVVSDVSVNVPYEGKRLSTGELVYWKLRVWDKDGIPSVWSAVARFEMGLLERINVQHRLVYQVLEKEKTVKIIRLWTHYE